MTKETRQSVTEAEEERRAQLRGRRGVEAPSGKSEVEVWWWGGDKRNSFGFEEMLLIRMGCVCVCALMRVRVCVCVC